jgi:hypothetical protein
MLHYSSFFTKFIPILLGKAQVRLVVQVSLRRYGVVAGIHGQKITLSTQNWCRFGRWAQARDCLVKNFVCYSAEYVQAGTLVDAVPARTRKSESGCRYG